MSEEMTLFETKLNLSREEQSKAVTVQKLAPLGDLYVCDAFAAAHRSQPTLVGFEEVLPSAMGRLFEEEFCVISGVMEAPVHPCVFILGGAKVQDAFMMMSTVLAGGVADQVLTGGLVANIILMAKGIDIGTNSTDFIYANNLGEYIVTAKSILEKHGDKIVLPVDFAYVNAERKEILVDELPVDEMLVDIGRKTVEKYVDIIKKAKTIFVNGPMGIFEKPETEYGTRTIWNAVAVADGYSVVGGGDSVAAANKFGVADQMSYICTGGGALIRFLTGEELLVVSALRHAAQKFGSCNTK
jgi:phosphoglycerate kinase